MRDSTEKPKQLLGRVLCNQMCSSYLAFAGGIQLATSIGVLVNLYFAKPTFLSIPYLVSGACLFLVSSFLSMSLAWTSSFVSLCVKRVERTYWEAEEEIAELLEHKVGFLFWKVPRSVKVLVGLGLDTLVTIAALSLGVLGRVG